MWNEGRELGVYMGGLWVMGLVHLEGLFEIFFDECVLSMEIIRVFLWTHVIQWYTLIDFDSEMIIYRDTFVQA